MRSGLVRRGRGRIFMGRGMIDLGWVWWVSGKSIRLGIRKEWRWSIFMRHFG